MRRPDSAFVGSEVPCLTWGNGACARDNDGYYCSMTSNANRLLAAATEVFAERGYDRAGVAEIARRAGLTTGAIYSRYTGKAELLVDALDAQMANHLEMVLSSAAFEDATDTLSMLGSHLLESEHAGADALFLEAVVATRREPEIADMLERRLEDERMRVAKVLDEAKAQGGFDPALDARAVLTFNQALGLGFTIFRTIGSPMPDPEAWQVVIDRVIAAALPPTGEQV